MLKGITVKLYTREQIGTDGFGAPEYSESAVEVNNVLVAPSSVDDLANTTNVNGTKELYTIAIPKGDDNEWLHHKVEFFGKIWNCYAVLEGIEENIPMKWHKKALVEFYG